MTASPAVHSSRDAAAALDAAGDFLRRDPVHNNLVLSLLADRVARPEAGRYWWVEEAGEVAGFAFQSPLHFRAVVASAGPAVLDLLVERMATEVPGLPGVMGEAATTAGFAGRWAERRATPVLPVEGQRMYRLGTLRPPSGVPGRLRLAGPGDRDLLLGWVTGFLDDTGINGFAPGDLVDRHLARGLSVWEDDDRPVSMAVASPPAAGLSRIGFVYTPPAHRRRGYGAAGVSALSARVLADGAGCLLYTQLQNPTSNAMYRRIGYEPVVEVLIYRFG